MVLFEIAIVKHLILKKGLEYLMNYQLMGIKRYIFVGLSFLAYCFFSQYVYAHGMSEAEKLAIINGGNLSYIKLGATHMLSGYDHLAFVFGIIFFLTSFKDIAKYVTAFTLGHSVTLIYATFNAVQVNYFIIDAIIGLSVSYIAFSNIDGFKKYLDVKTPNMMVMIVGLGLIHGLGLSTRLQELPLSEDNLLMNIISFNVGIELGQLSALAIMLILVAALRKRESFKTFSLIVNYALILTGLFLFLMQMHGYEHNYSEEFTSTTDSQASLNIEEEAIDEIRKDIITIVIPARSSKEYKFYLVNGSVIDFEWETNGSELFFDFHGEPAGDETGYFKSFKKSTDTQGKGALTAVFEGTYGWFWKNKTSSPVTITLKSKGSYKRLDEKANEPPQEETSPTHDTID
jgi:hypothetical protein